MAGARKSEWMRGSEKARHYEMDFKKGRFRSRNLQADVWNRRVQRKRRTQSLRTGMLRSFLNSKKK